MDIFRFNNPVATTKLEHGEIVDGLKSKMWIERYRDAGEFTIVADIRSGAREKLPIGSIISHVDTTEVMLVENHELSEERGKATEVVITGRGFETYLENRVVGSNETFPRPLGPFAPFTLAADKTWGQVVSLIQQHIYASLLVDDDNALPYVEVLHELSGAGVTEMRVAKRGDLYSAVLEILDIEKLGIKVVRPGPWSPAVTPENVALVVHKGADLTESVVFSYDTGEIEKADYLWSNKKLKNAVDISGNWVHTQVLGASTNFDRRMLYIDGSDIDKWYSADSFVYAPTLEADVIAQMQQRGIEALAKHNEIALTKAEVSKGVVKAGYRDDFNVGDLITVSGDYNTTTTRKISEYVEIEDENGSTAYPTLTTV